MKFASRVVGLTVFIILSSLTAAYGASPIPVHTERICQHVSQNEWMRIDCGMTDTGFHRFISEIRYAQFGPLNHTCPWPRAFTCSLPVKDAVEELCLNSDYCRLKADPVRLGIVDDRCSDVAGRSLAVVVLCSDPTPIPSETPSESPSNTYTPTSSPSVTSTPTELPSYTPTSTATDTPSRTRRPTRYTRTPSPTTTRLPPSSTRTPSASPSPSTSPTATALPSHTRKPSRTRTHTSTHTQTRTRSQTRSPSRTSTPVPTSTPTLLKPSVRQLPPTSTRTPTRRPNTPKPTPFPKTHTPTRKPTRATRVRGSTSPRPAPTFSNRTLCSRCIQYTLGVPEFVKDPDFSTDKSIYYPDQAFVATRLANGDFLGYSALGGTDIIVMGPKLTDRVFINVNIKPDAPNYYTHVMEAAWYDQDADLVRGWVHIETNTCGGGMFHGEIYYVESDDHGLTFHPERCRYDPPRPYRNCSMKADFGKNVSSPDWTHTSPGPYFKTPAQIADTRTTNTGTGAHYGVLVGDYYHIYYTEYWAEYIEQGRVSNRHGICLTRAHKSTGGVPGSFKKYYRGRFSEDGVNGKCSPIANISGSAVTAVPMSNTGEWVYASVPPNWAGFMSVSLDGINFDRLNGPLLPSFMVRPGQPANQWFMGYLSIVVDENDQPYLYAMAILSDTGIRNIIRYPLTYHKASNPSVCGGRITLTRFKSRTSSDVAVQFQPKEPSKYITMGGVAFLSTCAANTNIKLVECFIRTSRLHFLAQEAECARDASAPDGTNHTMITKGTAGYAKVQYQSGLVALWRCWFPRQRHFDVLTSPGSAGHPCEANGGVEQKLLGYAMPLGSSAATFSAGRSFYDPAWTYNLPDSTLVEPIPVPTFGAQRKIPTNAPTPLAKQQ